MGLFGRVTANIAPIAVTPTVIMPLHMPDASPANQVVRGLNPTPSSPQVTPILPPGCPKPDSDLPILDPWISPINISSRPPSPLFDELPVMYDTHGIAEAIKSLDETFIFDGNNNDAVLRDLYHDLDLNLFAKCAGIGYTPCVCYELTYSRLWQIPPETFSLSYHVLYAIYSGLLSFTIIGHRELSFLHILLPLELILLDASFSCDGLISFSLLFFQVALYAIFSCSDQSSCLSDLIWFGLLLFWYMLLLCLLICSLYPSVCHAAIPLSLSQFLAFTFMLAMICMPSFQSLVMFILHRMFPSFEVFFVP